MTRYLTDDAVGRSFDLQPGDLLVCNDRPGLRLHVLAGGLWLTEEDSLQDRFGTPGDWLRVEHRGRAVAEALAPTRVRLAEPARASDDGWRARFWNGWRRGLLAVARSPAFVLALLVGLGLPEMLARVFQQGAFA